MKPKSTLLSAAACAAMLIWLAPSGAPGQNYSATTETARGLHTVTFEVPQGFITATLPADMAAGDRVSGAMIAEPAGITDREIEANRGLLGAYRVEIAEITDRQAPVSAGSGTWTLPSGTARVHLVLKDAQGVERARAGVPVLPPSPAVQAGFDLPAVGQAGQPLRVPGPFDGDFGNTSVSIAQKAQRRMVGSGRISGRVMAAPGASTEPLAESPRGLVVRTPSEFIGTATLSLQEGSLGQSGDLRIAAVYLEVPKLSLRRDERTTLTIKVVGLEGFSAAVPLAVRNLSPGTLRMEGGTVQILTIPPQNGPYEAAIPLTGVGPGAFSIEAVIQPETVKAVESATPSPPPVFSRAPAPAPAMPAEPVDPTVVRFQFYAAGDFRFSETNRNLWEEAIGWWADRIKEQCGENPPVERAVNLGVDRASLPEKKARFTTRTSGWESWVLGDDELKRYIGRTTSRRDFHIGVFKEVKVRDPVEDRTNAASGHYLPPNILAIMFKATRVGESERVHLIGHLFGLGHDDGGVMSKFYPRGPGSEPAYGNLGEWPPGWCEKIAAHLNEN